MIRTDALTDGDKLLIIGTGFGFVAFVLAATVCIVQPTCLVHRKLWGKRERGELSLQEEHSSWSWKFWNGHLLIWNQFGDRLRLASCFIRSLILLPMLVYCTWILQLKVDREHYHTLSVRIRFGFMEKFPFVICKERAARIKAAKQMGIPIPLAVLSSDIRKSQPSLTEDEEDKKEATTTFAFQRGGVRDSTYSSMSSGSRGDTSIIVSRFFPPFGFIRGNFSFSSGSILLWHQIFTASILRKFRNRTFAVALRFHVMSQNWVGLVLRSRASRVDCSRWVIR